MPLTVGTAGHIDHGKTWLVRALTGKDTDRLPEEQARGISIDLGYAPLDLPDGRRLSVVDVPGHERFVRTMVAGATGIDLFLLVIDAVEGARPQTHEHLAILRLLGVERGVVAVTKADVTDPRPVVEEARTLVPLAPVVAVSAKTGTGLDELRAALATVAHDTQANDDRPTRLPIDRVFTLHGIGTVVTGTLWSGTIARGDVLRAEPGARDVRVRSVQVHDSDVGVAEAGQRVAVSLPGVKRDQLRRGDVLVELGAYTPSYRLEVELRELAPIPARALVHHGTSTTLARVARAGSFAQLRLAAPVVAARGDRVILRAGTTVGGGVVLDPTPQRQKRRAEGPAATPHRPAPRPDLTGREDEVADLERQLSLEPVKADAGLVRILEERGRLVRVGDGFAIATAEYARAREMLVDECTAAGSITLARFRDLLGSSRKTSQLLLERFDTDGITRRVGDVRVLRRSARTR